MIILFNLETRSAHPISGGVPWTVKLKRTRQHICECGPIGYAPWQCPYMRPASTPPSFSQLFAKRRGLFFACVELTETTGKYLSFMRLLLRFRSPASNMIHLFLLAGVSRPLPGMQRELQNNRDNACWLLRIQPLVDPHPHYMRHLIWHRSASQCLTSHCLILLHTTHPLSRVSLPKAGSAHPVPIKSVAVRP